MAKMWKLNIEKATLYFGIYSIIQATGAIIFSIVVLSSYEHLFSKILAPWPPPNNRGIKIGGVDFFATTDADRARDKEEKEFLDSGGPLILMAFAVVSLLISVLLVIGVLKRKASLVLTFFIGGVILTTISLIFAVRFIVPLMFTEYPVGALYTAFVLLLIYIPGLVVSHKTYKNMKANNGPYVEFNPIIPAE